MAGAGCQIQLNLGKWRHCGRGPWVGRCAQLTPLSAYRWFFLQADDLSSWPDSRRSSPEVETELDISVAESDPDEVPQSIRWVSVVENQSISIPRLKDDLDLTDVEYSPTKTEVLQIGVATEARNDDLQLFRIRTRKIRPTSRVYALICMNRLMHVCYVCIICVRDYALYVRLRKYTYMRTSKLTCICTYAYMYVCSVHIHTHTTVWIYTRVYVMYIHVCMNICLFICMYVCRVSHLYIESPSGSIDNSEAFSVHKI